LLVKDFAPEFSIEELDNATFLETFMEVFFLQSPGSMFIQSSYRTFDYEKLVKLKYKTEIPDVSFEMRKEKLLIIFKSYSIQMIKLFMK